MKITTGALPGATPISRSSESAAIEPIAASAAPQATSPHADTSQSAALQPALDALRALPDFDHTKVAALRDALQKGELTFDPSRLANLIQRFHGGER